VTRYAFIFAVVFAVLGIGPAAQVRAQDPSRPAPSVPAPPFTVVAEGSYSAVAGSALIEAFDRSMQELDAAPEQLTPTDVKNATFRRRLLELRLLMDFGAFAYDPSLLETFRDIVDDPYERVGSYQDVDVTQELLMTQVRSDIVGVRLVKMNVALATLRSPTVRQMMRDFLAASSSSIRGLEPNDVPTLWTIAGQTPSDQLDATGNAALLGASALAGIQGSNPFISDVFDPVQEEHFHDVRKGIRATLLLMNMFPDTQRALVGTAEPLFALVSQYGDVNDAFIAYRMALTLGLSQDAPAAYLRSEFVKAQARQQVVLDSQSISALIDRLNAVQDAHRR
jgi:hypothetical protein